MATIIKTIPGILKNQEGLWSTQVVFSLTKDKRTQNLQLGTFEGIAIMIPLKAVRSEILEALKEE